MQALDINGARSRNRTGTPLRAGDFKSHASTSFAIRAVARYGAHISRSTNLTLLSRVKQSGKYIHQFPVKQVHSGSFQD